MMTLSDGPLRAGPDRRPIEAGRLLRVLRLAALACCAAPGVSQSGTPPPGPSPGETLSTTGHRITVEGHALDYTAHAGLLPIRVNETGELQGRVFFTYYALDRQPGSSLRPLTFLWNGGPGANSVLLHLFGFGPRRVRTADSPLDGPDCDCVLVDNAGTWLESTDLVFVDPIGTGFSRPARAGLADQFYGAREDAACIAEFVRVFLTAFDAWDRPLFVGGESYGTWRAGGVAKHLEERGIPVTGILLISGGIPVGAVEEEEMRVAQLLTARTAAAFHHGRLAPDLGRDLEEALARAEAWATSTYAPALARRAILSEAERGAVVLGLSRYTGLAVGQIDSDALVVNRQEFAQELLRDQGLELARFDTRLTTGAPAPPSGARAELVGRYLREELGFETDQAYQGLEQGYRPVSAPRSRGPAARWRYNHGVPGDAGPARLTVGDGPPGARPTWVLDALELNPKARVFVATGHFDSLNSCSLNRHLVSRLKPELQDNFTLACYPGGHMMYEDAAVRLRMKADVRAFLESATRDRNTPPPDPGEARTALAARAAFDGLPPTRREVVTTHHSIAFRGRELAYTARAGTLPIADNETAEVHANVFFVAYTVAPAPAGTQRPLLFAWNGGPGSNAGLLHVAAMGPRRLGMGDVFATADPAEMRAMVDNEATWLGATDLVFVDPVGTGYSRPTRAEYGAEFYDTVGDVESLAEFIRVYRTRFDAWDAPLFLAGESYGSLRAAAVARSLQRKGIDVRGIIFISGSPGLGSVPDTPNAALVLPSYTATALYHGRLSPERSADPEQTLGEARRWAQGPYADALLRRDSLTPAERSSLAAELSSFSGLPASLFEDSNLAVSGAAFSEHLLEDAGRILGRYDARLSRPRKPDEGIFDPREDASLAPLENTVSGNAPTMIRYLRYELGYQSDLFYMGPFGGAWPPPERFRADWMSVRWNRSEGPSAPLLEVLAGNPDLRVLHASGTYDLVTPAGPPAYQIDRLPPDLRDRFTVRVYEGGHSFYFDRDCRMRFMEDGTRLIEAASRR